MESEALRLYWRETLIGFVYDAAWSDFPWVCGRFEPTDTECEVRALLQWFHDENKTEDPDLTKAPFPDEYIDSWYLEKPDGTRQEVMPPIPDFDDMTIEFR